MQRKETAKTDRISLVYPASRLVRLFYQHDAMACEGAIVHFADTTKTIITLRIKDLKMFGLETNFESTRPIPHHVETKTERLSSRPRSRPQKIGLETETGLETYITGCDFTSLFSMAAWL